MSNLIPSILPEILEQTTGKPTGPLHFLRLGGGSINTTGKIITSDHRAWFCKINDAEKFPDMFTKERRGLQLLRSQNIIRIPEVLLSTTIDSRQFLLMDWIEPGVPTPAAWEAFGHQLAALHRIESPQFGLDHDNYMGSLPQSNQPSASWSEFFFLRRLLPLITQVAGKYIDAAGMSRFERLYKALPGIFPAEDRPGLLHGDLWSGNYLFDQSAAPVLIDPAVYYGHRSVDLAMTTLFGGFDARFYSAYNDHFPLPPNYREQWAICNLYPLLVHLILFGESYLASILRTIQPF